MKKSIVGVMLTLLLMGQAKAPVEASEIQVKEDQQHVIYRVYVDNEIVGSISDITVYDKFLETKMRTLLQENEGQVIQEPTNVMIEQEVSLLPPTNIDDEAVLNIVEDRANFKTSAHLIKIGNRSFMVSDKTVVEKTVYDLMAYFSSEADFKRLKNNNVKDEPLTEDGSRYVGVKLSDQTLVKSETGVFKADDVLTSEQARRFMLYGQTTPLKTAVFNENSSLWSIANGAGLTEEELVLLNPGIDKLSWA